MDLLKQAFIFRQKPRTCRYHNKVSYTKKEAQEAKNRSLARRHTLLRIYQCPTGDHWHLTHTKVRKLRK